MNIHLHVIEAGGSAFHHLDDRQAGAPIGILIRHLLLDGVDSSKEPVHKAQIIRYISHKRHIGVGMAVNKPRDGKLVLSVNDLVGRKIFRFMSDSGNAAAFNINIRFLHRIFFVREPACGVRRFLLLRKNSQYIV